MWIQPLESIECQVDGKKLSVPKNLLSQFYQACVEVPGVHDKSPKWMNYNGGRSEFEAFRQMKLLNWLKSEERPGLKRCMIIGDSIRMRLGDTSGYGFFAYQSLVGKVNLTHVPHNTGGTIFVKPNIEHWTECRPDIVHINAGLHDLAVNPRGEEPPYSYHSPEDYAENLRLVFQSLKGRGVEHIIWADNTPVLDDWHLYRPGTETLRKVVRYNKDVQTYNTRAFGKDFSGIEPLLYLILIGNFFEGCFGTVRQSLVMAGRNVVNTVNYVVAIAVNILLCVGLAPEWGVQGIAVSFSFTMVVLSLTRVFQFYRIYRISPLSWGQLKFLGLEAIVVSTAAFAVVQLPADSYARLALCALGFFVFVVVLFWKEKDLVLDKLRSHG
jgi:hypothetical protein